MQPCCQPRTHPGAFTPFASFLSIPQPPSLAGAGEGRALLVTRPWGHLGEISLQISGSSQHTRAAHMTPANSIPTTLQTNSSASGREKQMTGKEEMLRKAVGNDHLSHPAFTQPSAAALGLRRENHVPGLGKQGENQEEKKYL